MTTENKDFSPMKDYAIVGLDVVPTYTGEAAFATFLGRLTARNIKEYKLNPALVIGVRLLSDPLLRNGLMVITSLDKIKPLVSLYLTEAKYNWKGFGVLKRGTWDTKDDEEISGIIANSIASLQYDFGRWGIKHVGERLQRLIEKADEDLPDYQRILEFVK